MARKKRTGERVDWLHLVVTVLPEKNIFKLVKFPPELEANQFCYAFRVTIKLEDWLERIENSKDGRPLSSNFYELLPVHYDDAPHDFRIKQLEMEDEIKRAFEELSQARRNFNILCQDLLESKKIGDEVIARLGEAFK